MREIAWRTTATGKKFSFLFTQGTLTARRSSRGQNVASRFIRRFTVHCRSLDNAPSAAAADVRVSYSHAMSHGNGRADDAHLAHATRYRYLPTRGFANAPIGATSHAGGTVLGEW